MNIKTGCMFLAFWNICAVVQIVQDALKGVARGGPRTQQQEIRIKSM